MMHFRFLLLSAAGLAIGASVALDADAQGTSELPARIIVKLRTSSSPQDGSAQQVLARQRERPSDAVIASLSSRAGTPLSWVKALADGSHVITPADPHGRHSARTLAARLQHAPETAWSQPDAVVAPLSGVSDPYYASLWALKFPNGGSFGADFAGAWALQEAQASARVAIIDTGVVPHPDLVGSLGPWVSQHGALASEGYDFISDCRIRATCPASTPSASAVVEPQPQALDRGDWVSDADRATAFFSGCARSPSSWHGTHTAGTVAALANNDIGIVGAAYGAKLVPVRVLGKCGGYMSDVAEGIRWAAGVHPSIPNSTPARIINLSLGAPGACEPTLQAAIDAATVAGAVVVVAAGNETSEASASMLPSCSNVLVVAATTTAGDLAFYSNYSATHVALAAPGGDMRSGSSGGILSLSNAGTTIHDPNVWTYKFAQGTSSAAPHAAAAAAVMLSRNGTLSPARLRSMLTAPTSVTPFPAGSHCAINDVCGAGLLNAQRAAANALSPLKPDRDTLDFGSVARGESDSLNLEVLNQSSGPTTIGSVTFDDASGFSLTVDECSGRTLAASQTCRVQVTLAPMSEGSVERVLQLPTHAAKEGSVSAVLVTAIVGSRLTSPTPTISLAPWPVGETRRVTVGFASRYQQSVNVKGVYTSEAEQAAISKDECSNTELANGLTCEVEVTLTALRSGPMAVRVTANTVGSDDLPFVVTIAGEVIGTTPSPPGDSGTNERPSASAPVSSTSSGSGGGGAIGLLSVLLLASAAVVKRFSTKRAQ